MRAKAQIHIFTVNTDGNVNFDLILHLSNLEIDESDPFFLDSKPDPFLEPQKKSHFFDSKSDPFLEPQKKNLSFRN